MKITKHLIFFFLILSLQLVAQTDSSLTHLSGYVKNIEAFTRQYPQEKVYLHFDNTGYYLGEHIWFKAYVVKATNHLPTNLSRVLYVELLSPEGDVIETKKLKVENGQCHGDFLLKDSLFAGYYEVRAYTRYMLNFGNREYISSPLADGQETEYRKSTPVSFGDYVIYPNGYDRKNGYRTSKLNEWNLAGASALNIRGVSQGSARTLLLDICEKKCIENEPTFSRVFAVYDRPKKPGAYTEKNMYQRRRQFENRADENKEKPEVLLLFFPEGGSLVEGLPSKVAFKAVSDKGENLDVKGVLKSRNEEVLSEIETGFQGMGVFSFTPDTGNVTAEVYYKQKTYRIPLSKAEAQGYVMTVNPLFKDKVSVEISKSPGQPSQMLGLIFSCRGKVGFFDTLSVQTGEPFRMNIPYERLSTGVNQLTLFDTFGKVLSERLIFINNEDYKEVKMFLDVENKGLQPYEPIRLNVLLQDVGDEPLEETFSLAVRDAETLDLSYHTDNVLTNLLLSSDLKGYILNPAYYFESNDREHKYHADLLMLTQGWRRYVWREMAGVDPFAFRQPMEKGILIDGTVSKVFEEGSAEAPDQNTSDQNSTQSHTGIEGLSQRVATAADLVKASMGTSSPMAASCDLIAGSNYDKLPKAQLSINLNGPNNELIHADAKADENAYFKTLVGDIYGTWDLTLVAQNEKQKKISMENFLTLKLEDHLISLNRYFSPTPKQNLSYYQTAIPYSHREGNPQNVKAESFPKDLQINEITVKAKKIVRRKFDLDHPNYKFSVKEEVDFLQDLLYLNEDYDERARQKELDRIIKFACIRRGFSNAVVTTIRDLPYDCVRNDWYTWSDMDSVYIYSDLATRQRFATKSQLEDEKVPDIVVKIKSFKTDQPPHYRKAIRRAIIQGYSTVSEFYHPGYKDHVLPQKPDFRRTLYWNPNVKTDSTGKAQVTFYNNSTCSRINVCAEGVTLGGVPVVGINLETKP